MGSGRNASSLYTDQNSVHLGSPRSSARFFGPPQFLRTLAHIAASSGWRLVVDRWSGDWRVFSAHNPHEDACGEQIPRKGDMNCALNPSANQEKLNSSVTGAVQMASK
jgi:hypothetical protein